MGILKLQAANVVFTPAKIQLTPAILRSNVPSLCSAISGMIKG